MPIRNFKRVCEIAAGFCDILSRMVLFAFFISSIRRNALPLTESYKQ